MSTSVAHNHREYNPTNQPFGTYALSPLQGAVRNLSLRHPSAWLGRSLRFFLRRWLPENRPYDVIAFGGSPVRLHVGDNKCERKMLFNPHNWDARERDRLADMVEDCGDEPF